MVAQACVARHERNSFTADTLDCGSSAKIISNSASESIMSHDSQAASKERPAVSQRQMVWNLRSALSASPLRDHNLAISFT
jgi:hypothetical protein